LNILDALDIKRGWPDTSGRLLFALVGDARRVYASF